MAPFVTDLDPFKEIYFYEINVFGYKQLTHPALDNEKVYRSKSIINAFPYQNGYLIFTDNVVQTEKQVFEGLSRDSRQALWNLVEKSDTTHVTKLATRYQLMLCRDITDRTVTFDTAPELQGMTEESYRKFMQEKARIEIGDKALMFGGITQLDQHDGRTSWGCKTPPPGSMQSPRTPGRNATTPRPRSVTPRTPFATTEAGGAHPGELVTLTAWHTSRKWFFCRPWAAANASSSFAKGASPLPCAPLSP